MEVVPAGGPLPALRVGSELPASRCACAACGGLDVELLRGEELLVDALELEEEALTTNGGMAHGD